MKKGARRPAALSALAYAAVAAFFARDLFPNLSRAIVSDAGDPVFEAAILHWNATRWPLSDAWWQFPIFAPTRDALTLSEHLLGLLPLSVPLLRITGDAIAGYNLLVVLTFPLCGVAMFALVHRLTGSAAAGFLGGLAFAFAPYRVSHLPHLHVLATFWTPVALLGLHGYLDSRRWPWLALYGVAFTLQGATNGYMLVFLVVFVALWTAWFVIAPRQWTALGAVGAATALALLPLVPIVWRYASVHAAHGFSRAVGEVQAYSADLAAVLCAPSQLTVWGWLRAGCRPEGELFPGIATAALCGVAVWRARAPATVPVSHVLTVLSRMALALALILSAAAVVVVAAGPWAVSLGPLSVSASSTAKPVMLAIASALVSIALSRRVRAAAKTSSVPGFYIVAALLTWALTLGPVVVFMDQPRGVPAPFALLLALPGVDALRVPARMWLLTTVCLAVLVGYGWLALRARGGRSRPALTLMAATVLLLGDGWIGRFPTARAPMMLSEAVPLESATVLSLPMGTLPDIAAAYRAVAGGWRSVNGYSGHFPHYYAALTDAAVDEIDAAVAPYRATEDLYVVVADEALRGKVEALVGATSVARTPLAAVYLLPRRPSAAPAVGGGESLPIARVDSSCAAEDARRVADRDTETRWHCGPQRPGQMLTLEIEVPAQLASVILVLGKYVHDYPRHLRVETSMDGESWLGAWDGSVRALLIAQGISAPSPVLRVAVPLGGQEARYVRLQQSGVDQNPWSLAELEVRASTVSGARGQGPGVRVEGRGLSQGRGTRDHEYQGLDACSSALSTKTTFTLDPDPSPLRQPSPLDPDPSPLRHPRPSPLTPRPCDSPRP